MNTLVKKRRAQSFLEYAVFITMVIMICAVMIYFFRNYQAGRIQAAADTIGFGEQYHP